VQQGGEEAQDDVSLGGVGGCAVRALCCYAVPLGSLQSLASAAPLSTPHATTPTPLPRNSPRQQARILAAWQAFEATLLELQEERRVLHARLAMMQEHLDRVPAPADATRREYECAQAVGTGISRVLQSDDHEALARALQDNMKREDQQWGIMSWSLALMIEEHQIGHIVALCYPYMPSFTQVFAAYVAEVLGQKTLV